MASADRPSSEAIRLSEERRQEIEDQIKNDQALTSEKRPVSDLLALYAVDSDFYKGVQTLEYSSMRTVRGDGNCYYRAFLYSLMEHLRDEPDEVKRLLDFVQNVSWPQVQAAGYEAMTTEIFYDAFVELLQKASTQSADDLHTEMNQENSTSDYCTWYMRVLTGTHLKSDPGRFEPFIEEPGMDVATFCQRRVEPMGQECEELQVLALAEALQVQVAVEYLDGRALVNGKVMQHVLGPEDAKLRLAFLYRPGHYDILYTK